MIRHGCDPFHDNNAGICPILFAMKNDCFVTFKYLFKDHHRFARFQQVIANHGELLWPLTISHMLDPIECNNSQQSFARYMVNVINQNQSIQNVLKNFAFRTNKNGDLPIEYFVKSSSKCTLNLCLLLIQTECVYLSCL